MGTGTIATPLLPQPVSGPVYEVASGIGLPGVAVVFGGKLPFTLLGKVGAGAGNRLQNTFGGLPDVPLSTFTLAIDGGPHGLLSASANLCKGPQRTVDGTFGGQNGATANVSAPVTVIGCPLSADASGRGFAGKRPRLSVTVTKPPWDRAPERLDQAPAQPEGAEGQARHLRARRLGPAEERLEAEQGHALPLASEERLDPHRRPPLGRLVPGGSKLLRTLKRHRSTDLRLSIRVLDVSGHTTVIPLQFTAKR